MSDEDAKKAGDQLQAHLDAMEARDAAERRERTAATVLAALIGNHVSPTTDVAGLAAQAVAFTDALRAGLAKAKP